MLENVYQSYRVLADEIDWKSYSINELFFKYIEHERDSLANNFFAGIVCRTWGYSGRIYLQCNKHVPFEQCYDIIIDTINYVLKKRVWENETSSLYRDPAGPDKAFHMVLKRQRSLLLASLNAYKRRSNFNTLSVDSIHEEYSDAAEGLFGIANTSSENNIELATYISSQTDPLDMIILDLICYSNWNSISGIVIKLKQLTEKNFSYFNTRYNISHEDYINVLDSIQSTKHKALLVHIKKLLYLARKDWE